MTRLETREANRGDVCCTPTTLARHTHTHQVTHTHTRPAQEHTPPPGQEHSPPSLCVFLDLEGREEGVLGGRRRVPSLEECVCVCVPGLGRGGGVPCLLGGKRSVPGLVCEFLAQGEGAPCRGGGRGGSKGDLSTKTCSFLEILETFVFFSFVCFIFFPFLHFSLLLLPNPLPITQNRHQGR